MWASFICGILVGLILCVGFTIKFKSERKTMSPHFIEPIQLSSIMYISMERLECGIRDSEITIERAIEVYKFVKAFCSNRRIPGRKWRVAFGVLVKDKLQIFPDSSRANCIHQIDLRRYNVELDAELSDRELFHKRHAIVLCPKFQSLKVFLYFSSGSEKEDWFYMLRRASKSVGVNKEFNDGMRILKQFNINSDPMSWLNVLLGRAFLALTSNKYFKTKLLERMNQKYNIEHSTSILGDIAIEDIDMGSSLPIFSNPRVDIDKMGNTVIDVSLNYTGGALLKAKSTIKVQIALWGTLSVPIVISITINRLDARLRFVIKSLHESNRIWLGIHRDPIINVEIGTELSSKHFQTGLINKIVENRIHLALEQYIILPRMDDFCFFDHADLNCNMESTASSDEELEQADIVDAYHLLPKSSDWIESLPGTAHGRINLPKEWAI
jgi:hypothetical protein